MSKGFSLCLFLLLFSVYCKQFPGMRPSSKEENMSKGMVLRVAPIWLIFLLCTCILFFLVLVATARRHRRRHESRSTSGRFEAAQCANPTHGVLKSGAYTELRFVRPAVLRAVRGHTSRRKRICADCIEKLSRKSEFRDLFRHKVGPYFM